MGAKLGNWMHDFLDRRMAQTAMGQLLAAELAIRENLKGCKMKQDAFDALCGCCGFWCLVQEHVLPCLSLGEARIAEVRKSFEESNSSLRSACGDLMLKEPPHFDSWQGMSVWLKTNLTGIKAAVEAGIEEAASEDPGTILADAEKVTISAGIYIGQITLDANAYREAKKQMCGDRDVAKASYDKAVQLHISDVCAAQSHYQQSDIVMVEYEQMSTGSCYAGKWVDRAVLMARENVTKLGKLHQW